MNSETNNLPPHDLTAERCLLGSMLLVSQAPEIGAVIQRARNVVSDRRAFWMAEHQILYATICEMIDAREPVDGVLLKARLSARHLLEEVGGVPKLTELLHAVPSAAHAVHYAGLVAEAWKRRRAEEAAKRFLARIHAPSDGGFDDDLAKVAGELSEIRTTGKGMKFVKLGDAVANAIKAISAGGKPHIPTGLKSLDEGYHILSAGAYVILAGRPSMGKSTLLKCILGAIAETGVSVGLISVEEPEEKIGQNFVTIGSGVDNHRVFSGQIAQEEWSAIDAARRRYAKVPFYFTDSAFNADAVAMAVEILVAQFGCKVVAVDHIHLVTGGRGENAEQRISDVSARLKELAKRLGIALIAAAQLRRPEKGQRVPLPRMDDLRASGAIEEHADSILLIHREDYYRRGERGYQKTHRAQLIIPKNRNGRTGDVLLLEDLAHQRFADLPEAPDPWAPRPDTGEDF